MHPLHSVKILTPKASLVKTNISQIFPDSPSFFVYFSAAQKPKGRGEKRPVPAKSRRFLGFCFLFLVVKILGLLNVTQLEVAY